MTSSAGHDGFKDFLTLPPQHMPLVPICQTTIEISHYNFCKCRILKSLSYLGHDGPEKIPRSTILLNRRTELLQKCRHKRKFTYAGMTSRQNKWNYEYPGNPTGTED